MGEKTNKKINEALSEEETKDAAGGIGVTLGDRSRSRCPRCGAFFERDPRILIEQYRCPLCGFFLKEDGKRML